MKKLLFSLSLIASLAIFAGESSVETTAQVYGVLPITSTATKVIVCVPWRAATSTNDEDIAVVDLIRTAELTEGDWIRVWDPTANSGAGAFKVWNLDANKNWVACETVTAGETIAATGDETLKRGDAVILYRSAAATASTFYVQGQYKAAAGETTTVVKGDSTTPAYTLLAPPYASGSAVNLNSKISSGSGVVGDHIVCGKDDGTSKYYQYNAKNGFGYSSKSGWVNPQFTPGTGCWYVSQGGQPTFTWD